ncbi:hypothetical protein [Persephonella sp.]
MDNTKLLGIKDILVLALPVVFGAVVFLTVKEYLISSIPPAYKIHIPSIDLPEKKYSKIEPEIMEAVLTVKPYTVQPAQKPETAEKTPPPQYRISFIYIGKEKYTIIDGKLYSEGDRLPSDEKIIKITKSGVLLKGRWGERWIEFSGQ